MSQFCARSVIQEVVSGIQRPEGFKNLLGWTAGLNGINSFGAFTPWDGTNVEVTFSCYLQGPQSWVVFTGNPDIENYIGIGVWPKSIRTGAADNTTLLVNGVVDGYFKEGFNTVSYTCTERVRYSLIGDHHGVPNYIKGQIYNLTLIDKSNSKNCRFFPGIIYSTEMPVTNTLEDKWCVNKEQYTADFVRDGHYYSPTAAASEVTVENASLKMKRIGADSSWMARGILPSQLMDLKANSVYRITSRFEGNVTINLWSDTDKVIVTAYSTPEQFEAGDVYFITKSAGRYDPIISALPSFDIGAIAYLHSLKIEEVTHGILFNLGSEEPYVPVLGDREAYAANNNNFGYVGGFRVNADSAEFLGANYGFSFVIPISAFLISKGCKLKVVESGNVSIICEKTQGTDQQLQSCFQYPNVFKVISPSDSDYGDYL